MHGASTQQYWLPRLAPDLFKYQSFITRASRRFQPYAWLQYDSQFRLKLATNSSLRWSFTDPELIATWLSADAAKIKQTCFTCGSPDHFVPDCPLKPSASTSGLHCPICNHVGHTACECSLLSREGQHSSGSRSISQVGTLDTTRFVEPITNMVSAFVVHDAPMHTHALHVTEGIPDVSAPSRHNDILAESIHTPQVFARFPSSHPDQAFVSRLIHSLINSSDIGYTGPHTRIFTRNLPSAYEHPTVVDDAPFSSPPFDNLHCSGVGIVPKKDGGWRLINHLSAPNGLSINDFIDSHDYSLLYTSVDDAIRICQTLGKGALMAKVDLKNAF